MSLRPSGHPQRAQLDLVLRHHDQISGIVIETGVLESLAHVDHVGRIGDDGEYLTIVGHVFGTGFGGLLQQVVEVNAFGRNNDLSLAFPEVEAHGTSGGQEPPVLWSGWNARRRPHGCGCR